MKRDIIIFLNAQVQGVFLMIKSIIFSFTNAIIYIHVIINHSLSLRYLMQV